jgi:hypothetical protein
MQLRAEILIIVTWRVALFETEYKWKDVSSK